MRPPPTRREAVVETLHGFAVPDPYRWLESGDDPEVDRWIAAQNAATRAVLDARPDRGMWRDRLVRLMELPVVLGAQVSNGVLVTLERARGTEQASLVARTASAPDATSRVLVDPSDGADATLAIDWFELSPDGGLAVFGTSLGGTENSVLEIVATRDGVRLDDRIPNTRSCSVGWEPDCSGFCYTRYPEGDEYHRTVHSHVIGADWHDDPVVWAKHPTPETWPAVQVSPSGRHVLVAAMVGWSRYDHHVLDRRTGEWRTLIGGVEAISAFVFGDDATLYGTTTLGAPRGRVVRLDLDPPPRSPDAWVTLVPERDVIVGSPRFTGDGLVVIATATAVDRVERYSLDGAAAGPPADLGVVSVVALAADRSSGDVFAATAGFDAPSTLWRLDPDAPLRCLPATTGDEPVPRLAVEQTTYRSADGTVIGIFLIHRADVEPSPSTAAILNGYGGFAISETPAWSPLIAAWCAAGGLYAIAGLRGGLEHGEEWHRAGRRERKQNAFDDFAAAADWLVATGRTSRERLAIAGGSNGGLLVGAALTQRPDLCRAVWCAVPLLDMIRFPRFLIARLWTDEYGDPDVADEFSWLYAYSPYHRIRVGECYPAVLLTTAEGDTRVDPMHARKMAAALQHATSCASERPILLHQEGRAGHGVGKPVSKRADEGADALGFFAWQLAFAPDGHAEPAHG